MNKLVISCFSFAVALLIGFSGPLFADDLKSGVKVLEPPESCSGYPIKITSPGSYKLGGNVDLARLKCNKSGIEISSGYVTLDLNGFIVKGNNPDCVNAGGDPEGPTGIDATVGCPSHPASSPSGCKPGEDFELEDGVGECSAPCHKGVTVEDGTVLNFTEDGVQLKDESTVDHVKAISNCGEGIVCGEGCLVSNSISNGNGFSGGGGDGFEVDDAATIISCVAQGNVGCGFNCDVPEFVVSLVNDTAQDNNGGNNCGCASTAGNQL
jgi:hypothetical protein